MFEPIPVAAGRPTLNFDLDLSAAVAGLVRLDERLAAAPAAVATGWLARAMVHEAAASARLDGAVVDPADLILFDGDALDRIADLDLAAAARTLALLRIAGRRHPRQLFTPLRLLALSRPRWQRAGDRGQDPLGWLTASTGDRERVGAVLERALAPGTVAAWKKLPAPLAAAAVLREWHRSGAAAVLGPAVGRILASAWIARSGLVVRPLPILALGFLGFRASYQPERAGGEAGDGDRGWQEAVLAALVRAADWGLVLHRRLTDCHQRLIAATEARRRTSRRPALARLLIAETTVTAARVAELLAMSTTAARTELDRLTALGLIRELSERASFRVYSAF